MELEHCCCNSPGGSGRGRSRQTVFPYGKRQAVVTMAGRGPHGYAASSCGTTRLLMYCSTCWTGIPPVCKTTLSSA